MPKIHQTSSRTSLLGQWGIFVGSAADFLNAIFIRPIHTTNVHGILIQLPFLCAPKISNWESFHKHPQNLISLRGSHQDKAEIKQGHA